MGRTAQVLSSERATVDGANVVDVKCDPGGKSNVTAEHFTDPGDDSLPLPGDTAALDDSSGTGVEKATGYADTKNAGKALEGEKRIYARTPSGELAAEVWLHGDGTVEVKSILPGSKINLNGLMIDQQGNLTTPGEVTAKAATPATSVSLSEHLHPSGTGPTGPPQPGT